MTTAVEDLSLRAKKALVALHGEFKIRLNQLDFAVKVGAIVHAPGCYKALSDEYESRVAEIFREGLTEAANDRYVPVKCPACGRSQNIAGDVTRWTCACGTTERYTFQTLEDPE